LSPQKAESKNGSDPFTPLLDRHIRKRSICHGMFPERRQCELRLIQITRVMYAVGKKLNAWILKRMSGRSWGRIWKSKVEVGSNQRGFGR
jgi:hypothetical protein